MTAFSLILWTALSACLLLGVDLVFEGKPFGMARVRRRAGRKRESPLSNPKTAFVLFAAAAVVLSFAFSWLLLLVTLPLAAFLAWHAPRQQRRMQARELREDCDRSLDGMADIVAMGVRAGLSFDASVGLYCEKFDNSLSRELNVAHGLWTSGVLSREQALEELGARLCSPSFDQFCETSLKAITQGAPLADLLTRFAVEMRRQRRLTVERKVAKAPVRMLLPTGMFILPAMLILVMGPVLIQFLSSGL